MHISLRDHFMPHTLSWAFHRLELRPASQIPNRSRKIENEKRMIKKEKNEEIIQNWARNNQTKCNNQDIVLKVTERPLHYYYFCVVAEAAAVLLLLLLSLLSVVLWSSVHWRMNRSGSQLNYLHLYYCLVGFLFTLAHVSSVTGDFNRRNRSTLIIPSMWPLCKM